MGEAKDFTTQKKYAAITHPMLEAVVLELLRLGSEEQALQWLEMLGGQFIVSRHQTTELPDRKSLIMWIRGYAVTPEEKTAGYTGHFASISYRPQDGKWVLYATKLPVELGHHPHKQYRNAQLHPNWGHPLLRQIKKQRRYASFEEAQHVLDTLHEAYPMASIPGKGKLYLMIFSRAKNREKPVEKYVFEIEVLPEGGFTIAYQLNSFKPKISSPKPAKETSQGPVGKFTSQVQLKRKR